MTDYMTEQEMICLWCGSSMYGKVVDDALKYEDGLCRSCRNTERRVLRGQ